MNTVARYLEEASSAVRSANHAALSGRLPLTDCYDVVGNLDELLTRLAQIVAHARRNVLNADATAYYDDCGRDPTEAITDADTALESAWSELSGARVWTGTAHAALGRLGRRHIEED